MLRQAFDLKLQSLWREVVDLGQLVDQSLGVSVAALTQQDVKWAKEFFAKGRGSISARCSAIETETMSLIATQQPVASDLRILVAVLEIITELDYISKYTAGMAQTTIAIGDEPLLESFRQIAPVMVDKTRAMLNQALLAFERQDVLIAQAVPAYDDEVDRLYVRISLELTTAIRAKPQVANQSTSLSRMAHNLERTADRVINICEWIIFAVTGEMKELNVSAG
jgi:phosphate transport system protein